MICWSSLWSVDLAFDLWPVDLAFDLAEEWFAAFFNRLPHDSWVSRQTHTLSDFLDHALVLLPGSISTVASWGRVFPEPVGTPYIIYCFKKKKGLYLTLSYPRIHCGPVWANTLHPSDAQIDHLELGVQEQYSGTILRRWMLGLSYYLNIDVRK